MYRDSHCKIHNIPHVASSHAWMRSWICCTTLISGFFAVAWLLLRTGSKPSRLAYPCQQAALSTATLAFGVPFVAVLLSLRRKLLAVLRTTTGGLIAGTLVAITLVVLARGTVDPWTGEMMLAPPDDYRADVFVVQNARGVEPGRFGGVDDLITLMGLRGFKLHRSDDVTRSAGSDGLISSDDVVLIKINAQWAQRGGTNTDVLRGVIRSVVEHPDGFVGEIVVVDNGQNGGSLTRSENNAEDTAQSVSDVVGDFVFEGWNVSAMLWDGIRGVAVDEYFDGDLTSGYIKNPQLDPESRVYVSYPKFRTTAGTYISYKHGVWSTKAQTYDAGKLVVINIPVLKTHRIYGITAAVKNHMGVITTGLNTDAHLGVARGGLGSFLAEVRRPDLNILDCIWILADPDRGPAALYEYATRRDQLLASTDPIALDMWAANFVMIPQIIENGFTYQDYAEGQDPDDPTSDFRSYMDRTLSELLIDDIYATTDLGHIRVHVWTGDLDEDGDIDWTDHAQLMDCVFGPGDTIPPDCAWADSDRDQDIDLADLAAIQSGFTGPLP